MRRRIAWKNKVTGFASHGEWQNWDADTAKEIAKRANLEFPIINHWVEDEPLRPYQQAALDAFLKLKKVRIPWPSGLGKGELLSPSGEPSEGDAVVNLYRP